MEKYRIALLYIICIVCIPLAVAETGSLNQTLSESPGLNFVIKDYTLNAELERKTLKVDEKELSDTGRVNIPGAVKKYDLVTFDQPMINAVLRSSSKGVQSALQKSMHSSQMVFQINGEDYPADLHRMDFESIDDGIESYAGTLAGEVNSSVLLTISNSAMIGSVTFNDETYYIEPVQWNVYDDSSSRPLHIIYNTKGVEERLMLIDSETTSSSKEALTVSSVSENVLPAVTMPDGRIPVTILVTTDRQFYSDHSGWGWRVVAQDIIAEANRQFGRDDIQVILVPVFDESNLDAFSNDPNIKINPLLVFDTLYPAAVLDAQSADLGIYLGGYNIEGVAQGASQGYTPFRSRTAWAQMVGDDLGYTGTRNGQRSITIHEIGHLFDAHHEIHDGPLSYNHAFQWGILPFNYRTVMWNEYSETVSTCEFSSDNYHGDATHDNARRIQETKAEVSGYASCSASPPTADFTWAPNPGLKNQLTTFQITSQTNNPTYYYWELGESGASSTDLAPTYTYTSAGTYNVRLTVANCAGSSVTEHDVVINPPPVDPVFNGNPMVGSAPLTVQYMDTTTPTPSSWNWNFGDGQTSTVQNPQHTYQNDGIYTVSLTAVVEGTSRTTTYENYITVAPQPATASFTTDVTSGIAPLTVQFTDTSAASPTSWEWDFGDGTLFNTTDPGQSSPTHTFTTTGTFTVSLTASNSIGGSTATQQIIVTDTPPPTNTDPVEWTVPGTYTYTVPAGIYSINATVVGAGGGGGGGCFGSGYGSGGSGGEAGNVVSQTMAVSPGNTISVIVGTKGACGSSQVSTGENGIAGGPGGQSQVGSLPAAAGGAGGAGGIWTYGILSPDGGNGENGFGTGQYAEAGASVSGTGGTGGIGRGAGGGGASYGVGAFFGGYGANGYVNITPILPSAPVAEFSTNVTEGITPLAIQFTDLSVNSPYAWVWSFGDTGSSNSQHPVHVYSAPRIYNVSLTVTNAGGSDTMTKTDLITVSSIPIPVSSFTATPTSGYTPLAVQFTDTSTNSPTNWSWDFGDGITSTEQNPSHIYNIAGNYTVNLTATNAGGSDSLVRESYITVLPRSIVSAGSAHVGQPGEVATLLLTMDTVPDGLGGYNLNLTFSNESVAYITAVSFPDWASSMNYNSPLPAGQDLIVKASDVNSLVESDAVNIVLANITVQGLVPGQTELLISRTNFDDDAGYDIPHVTVNGNVTVG